MRFVLPILGIFTVFFVNTELLAAGSASVHHKQSKKNIQNHLSSKIEEPSASESLYSIEAARFITLKNANQYKNYLIKKHHRPAFVLKKQERYVVYINPIKSASKKMPLKKKSVPQEKKKKNHEPSKIVQPSPSVISKSIEVARFITLKSANQYKNYLNKKYHSPVFLLKEKNRHLVYVGPIKSEAKRMALKEKIFPSSTESKSVEVKKDELNPANSSKTEKQKEAVAKPVSSKPEPSKSASSLLKDRFHEYRNYFSKKTQPSKSENKDQVVFDSKTKKQEVADTKPLSPKPESSKSASTSLKDSVHEYWNYFTKKSGPSKSENKDLAVSDSKTEKKELEVAKSVSPKPAPLKSPSPSLKDRVHEYRNYFSKKIRPSKSENKDLVVSEPTSKKQSPSFDDTLHQYKTYFSKKLHFSKAKPKNAADTKKVPEQPRSPFIPKIALQAGGAFISQGSAQHINIQDLIGDDFSVDHPVTGNGIGGLGLYWDGIKNQTVNLTYGVNVYYLSAQTSGQVTQEELFTNLDYSYSVTNVPLYLSGKAEFYNHFTNKANITIDLGLGPNMMNVNNFKEQPLDEDTLPDHIFLNRSTTTLSAMVGLGLKINDIFGSVPLECGYRFFYLGQSSFNKATFQALNELQTGTVYANALLCSITL